MAVTTMTQKRGLISDGATITPTRLTVRFTHDKLGNESLSISDDNAAMLQVDFQGIEEIIERARNYEK